MVFWKWPGVPKGVSCRSWLAYQNSNMKTRRRRSQIEGNLPLVISFDIQQLGLYCYWAVSWAGLRCSWGTLWRCLLMQPVSGECGLRRMKLQPIFHLRYQLHARVEWIDRAKVMSPTCRWKLTLLKGITTLTIRLGAQHVAEQIDGRSTRSIFMAMLDTCGCLRQSWDNTLACIFIALEITNYCLADMTSLPPFFFSSFKHISNLTNCLIIALTFLQDSSHRILSFNISIFCS